jgi:hypothetical protein
MIAAMMKTTHFKVNSLFPFDKRSESAVPQAVRRDAALVQQAPAWRFIDLTRYTCFGIVP